MAGTLYTYPNNPRAFRVLVTAQYSGANVQVAADYKHGVTNASADFLAMFPSGRIPAFKPEGSDLTLNNTAAICQYVATASDALKVQNAIEEAFVTELVNFADSELYRATCTWVYPTYGIMAFNKAATAKAQEEVQKWMAHMNKFLETRTFFVGERVSSADIAVATAMLELYQHVLEPAFRAPYPHVNRWFTTMVNQPQFLAVVGQVTLCEKMAQFNAEVFGQYQKQAASQKPKEKKEDKPKEAKKKEEKPKEKKEEKPKKEAKKEEADEEPEEDEFAEKPSKDPLAHLPPSSFVLDAFKRSYSNEDTPIAIDFFWKNFDAQNFSIWKCTYKYPDELAKIFMSSNLIGGFFQRIEKLRKYAFASMCVFGEDNNNQISGLWIWKGHDLVFELSEDWGIDYPSYDWVKLDPATDETKLLVKEYFMWEGEFKDVGKKFATGKIYK
jgi:elongation factor 1-gamma